ncbi:MAG: preprotein translocase subunit SecG [Rickettsiaceae bacterium]|nr:preprotein translocase subunit SecG [Rickettsiaceae bacterium]
MINTLLFIHLIIAILLIVVILLQKTSTDGLSGIGGCGNMGLVSGRSAANFLTKTTIVLAAVFFANALLLANLSSKQHDDIAKKLEQPNKKLEDTTIPQQEAVPIAK